MAANSPTTWDELLAGPFNIHVVTTHNSVVLAAMRDTLDLTDEAFHRMMRADHFRLTRNLGELGIAYSSLAKALVPDHRRREIALLFDSAVASLSSRGFYGIDVAEAWIAGLPRPRKGVPVNSILRGDILHDSADQVQAAMDVSVVYDRPFTVIHPSQVYVVYVTNLSEEQGNTLTASAAEHPAYIGHADCTDRSALKEHLGLSLMNSGLRVGDMILEGVSENGAEPNGAGLPFEALGFTPTAVIDTQFLPFLGYHINSHLTGMNREDNGLALTTLSPDAAYLESPDIWMTPGRYGYLQDGKHRDSMEQAGLLHLSQPALEVAVSKLVAQGYLYNLRLNEYGDLLYMALVDIEVEGRYRTFTIGLRFKLEDKRVELTTFF
ncbi:hypothetical protein OHB56_02030 [Streptomyces sp. NBC_01635]|uniref:Uncharacterized protein n=1 Tax=Streptomyces hirsutus TaxID=35620 RepID=A0ABZ1GY13_9ACTN|nr:hypothetical protein [Streptomyces hirsutus]WSD11116.1 hypothetical protein OIE73_39305 [Streptomyces hirsutus]WTD72876.1 hypothetical protein OHB56_02030 [Streptomyces sp. NBC_01635]